MVLLTAALAFGIRLSTFTVKYAAFVALRALSSLRGLFRHILELSFFIMLPSALVYVHHA